MESAKGTVKVERVYAEHYPTRKQARLSITQYLAYYNTERLHPSLDYVSRVNSSHGKCRVIQCRPTSRSSQATHRPAVDNSRKPVDGVHKMGIAPLCSRERDAHRKWISFLQLTASNPQHAFPLFATFRATPLRL
jgi:hypothetical protein